MRRAERKNRVSVVVCIFLNELFDVFSQKGDFPTCQEKEERDEKQDDQNGQGEDQKEAHNELLEVNEETPSSHLSSSHLSSVSR